MKRLACLAGLLLLAACAPRQQVRGAESRQIVDWRGQLEPVNDSGVRGAVAIRTGHGQTGVSVSIAGARPGSMHPWHIYSGACGSGGSIVGSTSAYPVLQVNSTGDASASAMLDVALHSGASYYVNISASPTDVETVLACGQVRP